MLLGIFYIFYVHLQTLKIYEPASSLPLEGDDWVIWQEQDGEIIAKYIHSIHSIHSKNPLKDDYVKVGDQLVSIDFIKIHNLETAKKIIKSAKPGQIQVFQVNRGDWYNQKTYNYFVINYFKTFLSFSKNEWLWLSYNWTISLLTLALFLILLILFPIIRNAKTSERFSIYVTLSLAGLVFLTLSLHQLYVNFAESLESIKIEQIYIILISILSIYYSLSVVYTVYKNRVYLLIGVIIGGAISYFLVRSIFYTGYFGVLQAWFERMLYLFITFHLLLSQILSFIEDFRKNRKNLIIHGSVGLIFLYLVFEQFLYFTKWRDPAEVNLYEDFLIQIGLFFPIIQIASDRLRFGKVSFVISKTIFFSIISAFIISIYILVRQFAAVLGISESFSLLFEIVFLLSVILFLRLSYTPISNFFAKYFTSSYQKKVRDLYTFSNSISRYTNSDKLLNDVKNELLDYFQLNKVSIWFKSDGKFEDSYSLKNSDLEYILFKLQKKAVYWSQAKELSALTLREKTEKVLLKADISLIFVIKSERYENGVVILGKPAKRNINLEDVEIIQHLIRQTELTLDLLSLVENEKVLIEKTLEANLTALRSQINPHFLFNTLNSISYLIHDEPEQAELAIDKLAKIFRYTLKFSTYNFVKMEDELSLIFNYLDIEKIRFAERLEIRKSVDESCLEQEIPAFILQTIVENAIEHGVAKIIEIGILQINVYKDEKYVFCEVIDNGPGIDQSKLMSSTGIVNIITRLNTLYQEKELISFENTGNGTRVLIKIPKKYDNNNKNLQSINR